MNAPHRDAGFFTESLASRDPALFAAVTDELGRQRDEIELIASENIVSRAVMEAQGSVMTNKYAEGYPGKRYYGGCQFVDVAENLAIERACQLFNVAYANVQPNSGSQANQGVFQALIKPGDTILGMSLDAGGHLTHGAAPNQSGKWFNAVQYGVRQDTLLPDYDQIERLALEHKPAMIIAGGSAGCGPSPTRWGPTCLWTWRISRGWLRPGCTPAPSRMRMWRPRPPTKPCAARAAG
jgi:glycine hydroxymethyltransferase